MGDKLPLTVYAQSSSEAFPSSLGVVLVDVFRLRLVDDPWRRGPQVQAAECAPAVRQSLDPVRYLLQPDVLVRARLR